MHLWDDVLRRAHQHLQDELWSNPNLSNIPKSVRYDFKNLDSFLLVDPSDCTRLSSWINTIHFYRGTSLAESMMQDGEKAYSSKKVKEGNWKKELSKII